MRSSPNRGGLNTKDSDTKDSGAKDTENAKDTDNAKDTSNAKNKDIGKHRLLITRNGLLKYTFNSMSHLPMCRVLCRLFH
jgi:hypothetical protein